MDGRTYGRTDIFPPSNIIRSTFGSRPKYTVREFQRSIGQFEVEKESKCTADNILTDIKVRFLSLIDVPGNDEALTQEHRAKGKIRVDSFLNFHRNKSVVIFSDGSTDYESIGIGSCAAVLLPLLTTEDEILSTEAFSAFTDNTEAEVRGIASALDMAVHYFSSRSPRNVRDKLFILCD